jgi:hypothetical protein
MRCATVRTGAVTEVCSGAPGGSIGDCGPPQPAKSAAAPMPSATRAKFDMSHASLKLGGQPVRTFVRTVSYPSALNDKPVAAALKGTAMSRSFVVLLVAAIVSFTGCSSASTGTPFSFAPPRPAAARPPANCLANPRGSGILTDGDFSQAPDPGSDQGIPVGTKFAPDWVVSERTIDFYGSDVSWDEPHALCSVDLDGSGHKGVGAITHVPVQTTVDAAYTISFILSGNVNCAPSQGNPRVKRLLVEAVSESGTIGQVFHWNTAHGHDAQHGDFSEKRFRFTALSENTSFVFQSLDRPDKSNCGPVVAGMSVTEN